MGSIEVKRCQDAPAAIEYGCKFRRMLPWVSQGPSDEGMAIAIVDPGTATTAHAHAEWEHFLVLSGNGVVWVDDEGTPCAPDDLVRVAPNCVHVVENKSATEPLKLMALWTMSGFGVTT